MASLDDDSKVMDVSKPGQGKPVGTSRPVVAPVVSNNAADGSVSATTPVSEPAEPLRAPSSSHKTIEPLSDDLKQTGEKPVENAPAADESSTSTTDDAAGVDALVSTAETKKEAAKKAEEQAQKDAELQSLIESKKYVVPIKAAASAGGKKWVVSAVIAILLLAGGYMLADAGVFGDVKVPFEIFKETTNETADDTSVKAPPSEQEDSPATEQEQKPAETETKPAEAEAAAPEVKARDTDRKNEAKNLQQKLETYFNDNDAYPLALSGLTPRPTTDELTDDNGLAYKYESDGQTYTLSATLENKDDKDAVNGIYTLMSVNQ